MAMRNVLLSFDIEEFDMPTEYGKTIGLDEQISISSKGTATILDILDRHQVKATFFSTVVFATRARPLIERLIADQHELASHGYYHSQFEERHFLESRIALEELGGMPVTGFRMPRMMPVDERALQRAGYTYNSSLNPVFIPGRYNNLDKPRTLFRSSDTWQLPASATPTMRIPLFWLSFHNFPLPFYKFACARTIRRDNYLNIYFHPWEFTDLGDARLGMPWFVKRNSGQDMIERFEDLILWMKKGGYKFDTVSSFLKSVVS